MDLAFHGQKGLFVCTSHVNFPLGFMASLSLSLVIMLHLYLCAYDTYAYGVLIINMDLAFGQQKVLLVRTTHGKMPPVTNPYMKHTFSLASNNWGFTKFMEKSTLQQVPR